MNAARSNEVNESGLSAFLRNKKAFRITAAAYALACVAGIVLLTGVNLSVPNSICLAVLGVLYITLYLVCYFRGHCERALAAGKIRWLHPVISAALAAAVLLACGLNLDGIREDRIRSEAFAKAEALRLSAVSPADGSADTDGIVTVRGIVSEGRDVNLYGIPLTEPWQFTEEGFITVCGETADALPVPVSPAEIEKVYARTRPDGGTLRMEAGEYSAEWSLRAEQEGEITLNLKALRKDGPEEKAGILPQILLWIIAVSVLTWLLMPLTIHAEQLFARSLKNPGDPGRRKEKKGLEKGNAEEQGGPVG